jgi:hypothetical protein
MFINTDTRTSTQPHGNTNGTVENKADNPLPQSPEPEIAIHSDAWPPERVFITIRGPQAHLGRQVEPSLTMR